MSGSVLTTQSAVSYRPSFLTSSQTAMNRLGFSNIGMSSPLGDAGMDVVILVESSVIPSLKTSHFSHPNIPAFRSRCVRINAKSIPQDCIKEKQNKLPFARVVVIVVDVVVCVLVDVGVVEGAVVLVVDKVVVPVLDVLVCVAKLGQTAGPVTT